MKKEDPNLVIVPTTNLNDKSHWNVHSLNLVSIVLHQIGLVFMWRNPEFQVIWLFLVQLMIGIVFLKMRKKITEEHGFNLLSLFLSAGLLL